MNATQQKSHFAKFYPTPLSHDDHIFEFKTHGASAPLNLKYLQFSDYAQALFCARHLAIKTYIQPRQLCLITDTSPLCVKFEYSHFDLQL